MFIIFKIKNKTEFKCPNPPVDDLHLDPILELLMNPEWWAQAPMLVLMARSPQELM